MRIRILLALAFFIAARAAPALAAGREAGKGAPASAGSPAVSDHGADREKLPALRIGMPLDDMMFAPHSMMEYVRPLMHMLEQKIGRRTEFVFVRSGPALVEAFRKGRVDLGAGDNTTYIRAREGAGVEPIFRMTVDGRETLRAAIYVRKDSDIQSLADLKGRTFAYTDEKSYQITDAVLRSANHHGLSGTRPYLCPTKAAAAQAVLLRQADAIAAGDYASRMEPYGTHFRAVAYSPPFPYPPVFARKDLDPKFRRQFFEAVRELSRQDLWRKANAWLGKVEVVPAKDQDYDVLRQWMREAEGARSKGTVPGCILRAGVALDDLFLAPHSMMEHLQPMIDTVEQSAGCRVEFVFFQTTDQLIKALNLGKVDIASGDEATYVLARAAAGVEPLFRAVINGRRTLRAVVLTRAESDIHSLSDLRDRVFAYTDKKSYSDYLFVDAAMRRVAPEGIAAAKQMKCPTKTSAVQAVLLNQADAVAASEDALRVEPYRSKMRAIAYSQPFVYPPVFARRDLDALLRKRIVSAVIQLSRTDLWRKINEPLGAVSIVPAADRDYDGLKQLYSHSLTGDSSKGRPR